MNGKIIISVPMEDVPKEVSRVLGKVTNELLVLASRSKALETFSNHLDAIKEIDEIRKRLNLLDANFEDCYIILIGFIKYHTEQASQKINRLEKKNDQ